MRDNITLDIIAHIRTDFPEKFGIPRQSGLVENLKGRIVFEPEYRDSTSLRGLEEFSHIWLLWKFSESVTDKWSPTVRPPRLGGNKRMGVFATRAPFRPNPIGLSCVKIEKIVSTKNEGTVIEVTGADMLDGTPIYDIKPYIPYTDSKPCAVGGFSDSVFGDLLKVEIPEELKEGIPEDILESLNGILAGDPRPSYIEDSERVFGFEFANYSIKFVVNEDVLKVIKLEKAQG